MSENLRKVLTGALMAGLGAVATYALDNLTALDIPASLLPLVTAVLGAAINAMRKAGWFSFAPAPTPPVVTPVVPAPSPVTPPTGPRRPLLDALLFLIEDRLRAKDKAGVDEALSLYTRMSEAAE